MYFLFSKNFNKNSVSVDEIIFLFKILANDTPILISKPCTLLTRNNIHRLLEISYTMKVNN